MIYGLFIYMRSHMNLMVESVFTNFGIDKLLKIPGIYKAQKMFFVFLKLQGMHFVSAIKDFSVN